MLTALRAFALLGCSNKQQQWQGLRASVVCMEEGKASMAPKGGLLV